MMTLRELVCSYTHTHTHPFLGRVLTKGGQLEQGSPSIPWYIIFFCDPQLLGSIRVAV